MEKWCLSEIRWASEDDLRLPFWSRYDRGRDHKDWADWWAEPFTFSRVPSSSHEHASGREGEFLHCPARWSHETDIRQELDAIFSKARHRAVITVKVGENGLPRKRLREIGDYLGVQVPNLPSMPLRSSSPLLPRGARTKKQELSRVLGLVVDSRDRPRSVAILVPHWESPFFLRMCLAQIKRRKNPALDEHLYVIDDMSGDGSYEAVRDEFGSESNVHFHQVERADRSYEPNVGYLLDVGLSLVREQYVASIDADLFPISEDWLSFPIWALESRGCSSAGMDTWLAASYAGLYGGEWWQPQLDDWQLRAGVYDNDTFSVTNNLYRVMPTALAKVVAENIGFQRCRPRPERGSAHKLWQKGNIALGYRPQRWFNPRRPYLPEGCDNGVAANHFIDINRLGPKFNIPLTSYIGMTPRDGAFGQNISGLVFHFALSTRALSSSRREIEEAGEEFRYWVQKLLKSERPNDDIAEELAEASAAANGHSLISPQWHAEELGYIRTLVEESRRYFDGERTGRLRTEG